MLLNTLIKHTYVCWLLEALRLLTRNKGSLAVRTASDQLGAISIETVTANQIVFISCVPASVCVCVRVSIRLQGKPDTAYKNIFF